LQQKKREFPAFFYARHPWRYRLIRFYAHFQSLAQALLHLVYLRVFAPKQRAQVTDAETPDK
jgi:hypothetical protein